MTRESRDELEQGVVGEISIDELMRHTSNICAEDRETASPGEARACRYFKDFMEGIGFEAQVLEIENFISLPIKASLRVLTP